MTHFYLTIDGIRQWKFRGDLVPDGRKDTLVFDTAGVTVGAGRTETVGAGQSVVVGAGRTENVAQGQTITVGSARTKTVGSGQTITVGSARTETVGSGQTITVGGSHTLQLDFFNPISNLADHVFYSIKLSQAKVEIGRSGGQGITFLFGSVGTSGHPPHPAFVAKFGRPH